MSEVLTARCCLFLGGTSGITNLTRHKPSTWQCVGLRRRHASVVPGDSGRDREMIAPTTQRCHHKNTPPADRGALADGEDFGWLGCAVARVVLRQVQALFKGTLRPWGTSGSPSVEPLVMDRDKRHSTTLTRERRGFPIWSAFEHDIRAFVL